MTPSMQPPLSAHEAPALRLTMALPHAWTQERPFPFNQHSLSYYYLARNAIYDLLHRCNLPGQEILFPAYFHGVELEALTAAGVTARFYPVHANMRVDVDDIRTRITSQTRAIYLIHYLGFPGPVEELSILTKEHGLLLIEDCALSLLSKLRDKPLGTFGDASIFCIYKSMPVPHGGALFLRSPQPGQPLKTEAPSLSSTLAYTASSVCRSRNSAWQQILLKAKHVAKTRAEGFGVVQVGSEHFNPAHVHLAMSSFCHWILAAQDYKSVVERRRANYAYLLKTLRNVAPPVLGELMPGVCPLSYPIRSRNKPGLLDGLRANGIEGVNMWSETPPGIPLGTFPEVDDLRSSIVELPCHQDLTLETMEHIARVVLKLQRIL